MITRSRLYILLLVLMAGSGFAQTSTAPNFIGPEKGALVIVGGGTITPDIWARFISLAGGKSGRIVVIPTAGEDSSLSRPAREVQQLRDLGITSITILHTRDPKVANQESFVAPLKSATGVWFVGGRHWRLADSYLNTLAHKELNALLARGGVIGGTSAGATILGSFMVRGDTKGNTIMVGDHTQGLDFIHNVTIDQHVMRRNRQFDLVDVIKARPELLGIGIDESTAILVQGNAFEVLGNSFVGIYDNDQITGKASKFPTGQNSGNGPFYYLSRGQRFDLQTRRFLSPPPARQNEPAR